MMQKLTESLEKLVDSHSQSFDKGERLNKQLALLQIYFKDIYCEQKPINTTNKHFTQYTSPEFESVLESAGFTKLEENFVFSSVPEVPCEELLSKVKEFRHLSFAEVVEIVQAGQTPPGIKQVNENPLGASSIKSETERPQKPWST